MFDCIVVHHELNFTTFIVVVNHVFHFFIISFLSEPYTGNQDRTYQHYQDESHFVSFASQARVAAMIQCSGVEYLIASSPS